MIYYKFLNEDMTSPYIGMGKESPFIWEVGKWYKRKKLYACKTLHDCINWAAIIPERKFKFFEVEISSLIKENHDEIICKHIKLLKEIPLPQKYIGCINYTTEEGIFASDHSKEYPYLLLAMFLHGQAIPPKELEPWIKKYENNTPKFRFVHVKSSNQIGIMDKESYERMEKNYER